MTALNEFLAGRGPAEMYEDYWVPCTLWPHAVSLAAKLGLDDIVAQKGEVWIVRHGRADGDHLAVETTGEEAVGIGPGETLVVEQARIPAFGRRPIDHQRHFLGRRPSYRESVRLDVCRRLLLGCCAHLR